MTMLHNILAARNVVEHQNSPLFNLISKSKYHVSATTTKPDFPRIAKTPSKTAFHNPAVMRLVSAPRRGLGRIGSSFRWRNTTTDSGTMGVPALIATAEVQRQSMECREDAEGRCSTPKAVLDQSKYGTEQAELEENIPNSFFSLGPPPYSGDDQDCDADADDDHTEKTDDETASAPSQDDQEKEESNSDDEVAQIDSVDTEDGTPPPGRRVTFAPTYKEIRFRKHENTRAIWYSREDRKKTIGQCAKEIADSVRLEPNTFKNLVEHCKAKQSSKLCDEFHNIMYVRGLLRPCLTRKAHTDRAVREWVQTPKRSVAAVLRVQQQGGSGSNLDTIYRMHTESPARWAHYLAVADAVEVQRKSPYEKVQV